MPNSEPCPLGKSSHTVTTSACAKGGFSSTLRCCAICVTYNADIPLLKNGIELVLSQLEKIYIVDNSSDGSLIENALSSFGVDNVEIIALSCNKGIATALNHGIKYARSAGFDFTLLLDQDSVPPLGMIDCYLEVFKTLEDNGQRVAALGSRYLDTQTGHYSKFVRFDWFRNSYHGSDSDSSIITADFLISSGSFYALNVFDDVGLFNDGLFIDHVDTEWCLRAKKCGYKCFGVWDLIMQHSLGEGGLCFRFFPGLIQPIHKPFRLYFITRNSFLLYRMRHVPLRWISGDVLRLLRLFFVYLIFSTDRKVSMSWMLQGLIDGIYGVTGAGRPFANKKAPTTSSLSRDK